jgi:hypothetical protein
MDSPEPRPTNGLTTTRLRRVVSALHSTAIVFGLALVCYLVALAVYAVGVYAWAPTPHDWPLLSSPDMLFTMMAGLVGTLGLWAAPNRRTRKHRAGVHRPTRAAGPDNRRGSRLGPVP